MPITASAPPTDPRKPHARAGAHPGRRRRIDVHQHLWTEPLLAELARRTSAPRLVREGNGWMLHLPGEPPCFVEPHDHDAVERSRLVADDALDLALIAISSPLGIEALPPDEAAPLLAAQHRGVAELPSMFGGWAAVPVADPDPDAAEALVADGFIGVSLPADAIATAAGLDHVGPLLERLEQLEAPLFVHPGPAPWSSVAPTGPWTPTWWPAMTTYVAQMHAAWLAFLATGRPLHPRLRIVFSMLAGGGPLQAERLTARGGPAGRLDDPLTFYDVSSCGPRAVGLAAEVVGSAQLVYGSDRPVVESALAALPQALHAAVLTDNPERLLLGSAVPR